MQYLAAVAHHTATTANTEQQVLQCNPVLEAFGNAKTLRNDNSSRFGKYIDIHFDERFALVGAKIDTYLLEKSRVVGQEQGERNFHIFYQLTAQAGQDAKLTRELHLKPAEHFEYIKRGANVAVAHRPATSLQNTLAALQAIGINDTERDELFKVLGGILHLGNIQFGGDREGGATLAEHDPTAVCCAEMLGCDLQKLVGSFVLRYIQAGPMVGGDSYTVSQSRQQVCVCGGGAGCVGGGEEAHASTGCEGG
jgi:myosin heavy subunit